VLWRSFFICQPLYKLKALVKVKHVVVRKEMKGRTLVKSDFGSCSDIKVVTKNQPITAVAPKLQMMYEVLMI